MAAQQRRGGRKRRKVCYFTANHIDNIDYKDVELLSRFISERGKNFTTSCDWYLCKTSKKINYCN
jgi:ribosomal protein S18